MVQAVNNSAMHTVRIKFKKVGNLQYISHLDLVRTMMKTVIRTKLPLWYTEGFNPKPKIVFAAPLSIGTESVCEFMDLRLTERVDENEIKTRFNGNLAEDMQVTEVYYPVTPLTDLKWLSYTITVKTDGVCEELCKSVSDTLSQNEIKIVKKTKRGEAETDIRPMIKQADVSLVGEQIQIKCILSADNASYLNPEYIIKVLKQSCGILSNPDLTKEYYSIMRDFAYRNDMSEFT